MLWISNLNSEFDIEVSDCECPEPEIIPVSGATAGTVVTIGSEKN